MATNLRQGEEAMLTTSTSGCGAALGGQTAEVWDMNDKQGERSLGQPKGIDGILDEHARLAGDIVKIDPHTWAIHGYIPVDGEVLLAEFDRPESARVALERLSAAET